MGVIDNELNWRGVRPVPGINGIWPAPDSIRLTLTGTQDGEGSSVIATVPANYKLYISSLFLASRNANAGANLGYIGVRDDEDAIQYLPVFHLYDLAGHQVSIPNYAPALEALEGWDIYVYSSHADLEAYASVFGWLEAV